MNDPNHLELANGWLERARSDLQLGRVALNTPGVMLEDACFHAQQCAEKSLKGLLTYLDIAFPGCLVGKKGVAHLVTGNKPLPGGCPQQGGFQIGLARPGEQGVDLQGM